MVYRAAALSLSYVSSGSSTILREKHFVDIGQLGFLSGEHAKEGCSAFGL
jgi:hypothetical protein